MTIEQELTEIELEDRTAEFLEMSMMELVDTWEQFLVPDVRARLLAELEARGYRIRSLPEPPSAPSEPVVATSPVERAQARTDVALRHVSRGVGAVFFVGVLQLVVSGIVGVSGWGDMQVELAKLAGLAGDAQVTLGDELVEVTIARTELWGGWIGSFALPLVLGVFFFITHHFAKRRPQLGLGLALGVYVGLHVMEAMADPSTIVKGAGLKILIVVALVRGLSSVRAAQRQIEGV
jgi:hypothetical protein